MLAKQKHSLLMMTLAVVVGLGAYFLFSPNVPAFSDYPAGEDRKLVFIEFFLPLIKNQNDEVSALRSELEDWYQQRDELGWIDEYQLSSLAERYALDAFDAEDDADWRELLARVDTVPASLALAQAAKESGWGTSRFADEGHNYYGQWCFEEGCGMVPKNRQSGKAHEVAAFDSPADSVEKYIHNLNTHKAYSGLRNMRAQARKKGQPVTGLMLAQGLVSYSERGQAYVEEVRGMIRHNQLSQYD